MRKSILALGGLACLGALTACGGTVTPGGTEDEVVLEGRWSAADPADAFVEFSEPDEDGAGTTAGSDGCNGMQGEYVLEGDTAEIERGLNTLKACPDVDDWLGSAVSVTVDGDTLVAHDGSGEELGTLTRD